MGLRIAFVGATGAVGAEFLKIADGWSTPISELRLLASARSAGSKLTFRGEEIEVGETTAESLASHFGDLGDLRDATPEALADVADVGPVVAARVHEFFADAHNGAVVDDLVALGVRWPEPERRASTPLAGETWVITGTLAAMTRNEAKARLVALGAKVAGSVSARTTRVVAGPGAGSKLQQAEQLEVPVVDEDGLLQTLRRYEADDGGDDEGS